ncbi:hypothetical protein ACGFMM_21915 [Streptomyces sp. NPDC048604]|uniref:hypothetical protein n=1 Tax=Streptomyces sp. NPDC048604 TaxID=3365578 RepID=UPI0037111749
MIRRTALSCCVAMLFVLGHGAAAQAATVERAPARSAAAVDPADLCSLIEQLIVALPGQIVDDLGWG